MTATRSKGRSRVGGRTAARARRHLRVRKKIAGTAARPRLSVTRSARHVVAQLVDDTAGRTVASASTLEAEVREATGDKKAKARRVGGLLASRAAAAGVTTAVFDRAGYAYQGRIAALADGAREGGLAL